MVGTRRSVWGEFARTSTSMMIYRNACGCRGRCYDASGGRRRCEEAQIGGCFRKAIKVMVLLSNAEACKCRKSEDVVDEWDTHLVELLDDDSG